MIFQSCRTSDPLAQDTRRLLWAAADVVDQVGEDHNCGPLTINAWPTECPDIASSVERFFPTSILFRDLSWEDNPGIHSDRSLDEFPGFLTAIYMAESVEHFNWGRLKVIAGRTILQPTTIPEEDQTRYEMMAALGKGVPLTEELGFRPRLLLRRLRGLDGASVDGLSPAEQLALVTVAAARNGPAVFYSEAGNWPESLPVQMAALNNRCRIFRFTLEGIPAESLERIRYARYLAPVGEG